MDFVQANHQKISSCWEDFSFFKPQFFPNHAKTVGTLRLLHLFFVKTVSEDVPFFPSKRMEPTNLPDLPFRKVRLRLEGCKNFFTSEEAPEVLPRGDGWAPPPSIVILWVGFNITMWVFPKIMDLLKMDGENKGKPYFLMDDLGVPLFSETSM